LGAGSTAACCRAHMCVLLLLETEEMTMQVFTSIGMMPTFGDVFWLAECPCQHASA
jgi:hypothetical protein